MNITVYLGALEGNDPALGDAVRELGTWIGESGNSLVYGGSKSGLMGQIAESVLNAGGKVTGVEPQFFIDSELQRSVLYTPLQEPFLPSGFLYNSHISFHLTLC